MLLMLFLLAITIQDENCIIYSETSKESQYDSYWNGSFSNHANTIFSEAEILLISVSIMSISSFKKF